MSSGIPGLPVLGQGLPGGAAGLPVGLPLPGGGISTGPPPPRYPALQQAPQRNSSNVLGVDVNQLENVQRQQKMVRAQQVLMRVRGGMIEWKDAQKQLDKIVGDDQELRRELTKQSLNNATSTGADARNELRALRSGLAPAGKSPGYSATATERPAGIGTNLLNDIAGTIQGMPAGIGLLGYNLGKDVGAVAQGKAPTNTYENILKPVGKGYAAEYGPLIKRGSLSGIEKHPLGPVLDAATLLSAGAGAAGRFAKAGEAMDALRTGAAAGKATQLPMTAVHQAGHAPVDSFDYERAIQAHLDEMGVGQDQGVKEFIANKIQADIDPHTQALAKDLSGHNVVIRPDLPHDGIEGLTHPDEPATPVYRVQVGNDPDNTFSVGVNRNGSRWVDDVRSMHPLDWEDRQGKPIPQSEQDAYYRAVQAAHGNQTGTITLHREMDPAEYEAWKRGDPIPRGKFFTDIPHAGMGQDVTGQFPNHYSFGVPRGDVVETAPNTYQLRGEGKLEGSRVFVPGTSPTSKDGVSFRQLVLAGVKGFTGAGPQGSLIDKYEKLRGTSHEAELQNLMQEIAGTLGNENLQLGRRKAGEVVKQVVADLRATRQVGRDRPIQMAADHPGFISPRSTGRVLSSGETTLREASDLVRAGAIYLRPAYLPNNWAGNVFMNAAHQGVLAPVNLAKSLVMDKHIGKRYTAAIDKSMGTTPAEVITAGRGRGYIGSLTQPMAHTMGAIADTPFRRAAFLHEARRAGYKKLSDVQKLMDRAAGEAGEAGKGDALGTMPDSAIRQVAEISRKAQEEIVKFGHMNETERAVIRNLIFVYSWVRGAGRYAARFPMAHPIQTNAYSKLGLDVGNPYIAKEMGGMPSFLRGSVPVGHDKNGNPILINPFALNPLGTALQVGQAAVGTAHVLRNPRSFNKYAQSDIFDLTNPLISSYVSAREGGQPYSTQLKNTIAATSLAKYLKHPGSGSIYPTTRKEALGHFAIGSLYPRVADQAAITKALEKENANHPEALIPAQVSRWEKATGQQMPAQLVEAYRKDLQKVQQVKDFRIHYASSHGSGGFKSMPPANQAEAGLQYLQHYKVVDPHTIAQLQQALKQATNDAEFKELSSAIWSISGAGQVKLSWDALMNEAKGMNLSRKR